MSAVTARRNHSANQEADLAYGLCGVAVLIAVFQSLGSLVVMHRHGGLWTELHEGDRLVGDLADAWVCISRALSSRSKPASSYRGDAD
jgi:hypothetical protein